MSNSLWPHGLQHIRLPCPFLSLRVCSYLCPLNQWYHPTILSSVAPFSPCPQSFPSSGSFLVSQLFASSGQSIGSASVSVLSMNIQGWFPLRLAGLISLLSKGLSRIFSSITIWKHQFFSPHPSLWSSHFQIVPQSRCTNLHSAQFYISFLFSTFSSTLFITSGSNAFLSDVYDVTPLSFDLCFPSGQRSLVGYIP